MNNTSLQLIKQVDKTIATVDEIINYTITINNNGSVDISSIDFSDIISSVGTFVIGSVLINNVSFPLADPNLGISLGPLTISSTIILTFQVKVAPLVLPNNILSNQATSTYTSVEGTASAQSNIVTTTINAVVLTVVKSVSSKAITGTSVQYVIDIQNKGNIDANNVFFIDPLPSESVFINGSVLVGQASRPTFNPNVGFNLGKISPTGGISVAFSANLYY